MSDALGKAIRKALSEKDGSDSYVLDESWAIGSVLQNYNSSRYFPLETEMGTVTIEESVEGGEDMGITNTHYVIKVTGGTNYYKVSGVYDSWDGGSWENKLKQVVPTPVQRIEFLEV